ncbi:hypothetical protein MSAN_02049700 [Mycena sanguinolenta]|uniref:Uncharacterized protein n=1 Tax=Mycena sanguinolenta TaxID=230812 RepID=A0A8H7CN07_9AGAR|nr:hypothetical protein MSAN_02049700 [Mycena sanguinolenta]
MSWQAYKTIPNDALYPIDLEQIAHEVDQALAGNFEFGDPPSSLDPDSLRILGCDNISVQDIMKTLNFDMGNLTIDLERIVDEVNQALAGNFEFHDLLPLDSDLDTDFLRFSGCVNPGELSNTLNPEFQSAARPAAFQNPTLADNVQTRNQVVDAVMYDVERAVAAFAAAGPNELDTLDSNDASLVKQMLDAVGSYPMSSSSSGPDEPQAPNTVLCDDFQNLKISRL